MVFHWSLSDSKSPQVSRTRLSIVAILNNALVHYYYYYYTGKFFTSVLADGLSPGSERQ